MPGSQTLSSWMVSFHSLDKSLASYKLSSWFLFTFWAAGKRVPDTWCPHSCERPGVLLHASCPSDIKIVGTFIFSPFYKKKKKKEDTVGNNLFFLVCLFWDPLPYFQTAEIDFEHL